jgi:tetratricopeptide (TPR) repeat protein
MSTAPYQHLKSLLKEANYDEALSIISRADLRSFVHAPDELSRLRFRCMISDVLDYGGRYDDAEFVLMDGGHHIGKTAKKELQNARDINDLRNAAVAKQQCWALLMWGMTYYRSFDFDSALEQFELARRVAAILDASAQIKAVGTLARTWYCIGLVHRENRESRRARAAFGEAIRLTGRGIEERRTEGKSAASFEFNMARCAGLGMGWIAYNEAKLKEAEAMLVISRGMMLPARAKLISAYLEMVQATITISASASAADLVRALDLLNNAHAVFAPEGSLQHTYYALRCKNEIAHAHLRLAWAWRSEPDRYEKHLLDAERAVAAVRSAAKPKKVARRVYCRALVTEARIKRERGLPDEALALAEEAKREGADSKLMRVDACIAIGEAEFARGVYGGATAAFLEALEKCKENRKDSAVCHLHLCEAYLKQNQPAKAREHFNLWESMSTDIENAFIEELGRKVRAALLGTIQNFVRTKEDVERDGDHRKHLNAFRSWLAATALALEHDDDQSAARHLHLHERTIKEWLSK